MGIEHKVKYIKDNGGFTDQYECSCGWKSQGYWDLVEAAWDEWLLHAYKVGVKVDKDSEARQARLVRDLNLEIKRLESAGLQIDKKIKQRKGMRP